ncbi:hypothetical protein EV356DRAFT_513011 [Viridothelium virens]|uniref:Uncharacterized protein n=1 Tax=Viridothelium virens TaxID=1048519 RepID=A0A6A6HE97_VIRVR|nr:hypothetical protein EV356DRAFT_513011 [Viridothelium virens]
MAAVITPGPSLAKRDGSVWGYVGGDSNSPLSCPSGLTPTQAGAAANMIICCNEASCVNAWGTCLPYLGNTLDPQICSDVYTSCLQCDVNTPSCLAYVRITDPQQVNGLTSLGCAATGGVINVLASATNGDSPASTIPTSTDTSGGSGNLFSGADSSTGGGQSSASHHSLGTGAIVGIIIGAIFVIAILVGLIILSIKWCKQGTKPKGKVGEPSNYADTDYEFRMREFARHPGP